MPVEMAVPSTATMPLLSPFLCFATVDKLRAFWLTARLVAG